MRGCASGLRDRGAELLGDASRGQFALALRTILGRKLFHEGNG